MSTTTATTERLLVDVSHAAELCGMSRSTFLRLEKVGRIGPRLLRLGRLRRVDRRQIERWIEAGCPSRAEWTRRHSTTAMEGHPRARSE